MKNYAFAIRRISVILLISVIFGVFASVSASAEMVPYFEPKDNVARGKTYKVTDSYTKGTMGYCSVEGNELTDGVFAPAADLYGTDWYAFYYSGRSTGEAVIDLGEKTDGLVLFKLHIINQTVSGISAPETMEFFISDNGKSFTSIGNGKYMESTSTGVAYWGLNLKTKTVSARYVKVVMGKPDGVFVFCDEFEIYNSTETQKDSSEIEEESEEPSEEPMIDKTEPLNANNYPVLFRSGSRFGTDDDKITGVLPGDTTADILRELDTVAGIQIVTPEGTYRNGKVASGDKLIQYVDKKPFDTYEIVISGDADCNGDVDAEDVIAIRDDILRTKELDENGKKAADINSDGIISATDCIASELNANGVSVLHETVYRNSEGVVETETGIEVYANLESVPMTVKRTAPRKYTINFTASNGKAGSIAFHQNNGVSGDSKWDTWNIGGMTVNGIDLISDSTDWEYVYRACIEDSTNWIWSGGNHGCEKCIDFTLYDGETGAVLDLDTVGNTANVNVLVAVEHTKLHWGDANGSVENYYADVTRKYTVIGQKVYLDVSYDFVKDCWFYLSYTCMVPVPKTTGLYIDFLNEDGTVRTVETLKVGAADYSGPSYSGNNASACRIYGYKNTEYSYLIQTYTRGDTSNNFKGKYKTGFWDMNTSQNKLYFGKFYAPGESKTKVSKGDHWQTASSWEILIDD